MVLNNYVIVAIVILRLLLYISLVVSNYSNTTQSAGVFFLLNKKKTRRDVALQHIFQQLMSKLSMSCIQCNKLFQCNSCITLIKSEFIHANSSPLLEMWIYLHIHLQQSVLVATKFWLIQFSS